jgi:hypothetical protein
MFQVGGIFLIGLFFFKLTDPNMHYVFSKFKYYNYNPSKFSSVEVGLKIISIGQFAMYLKVAFIIS